MSTAANAVGIAHAKALIRAGKVNRGKWSFTAEDGNKLLGANGDNWTNYAQWFLATHPDETVDTKAHYGYPFGKAGEVYRNALVSAKGRAAQQNATAVESACSTLLDLIDPPEEPPKMMQRAWAKLEIKAVDEELGIIDGMF